MLSLEVASTLNAVT